MSTPDQAYYSAILPDSDLTPWEHLNKEKMEFKKNLIEHHKEIELQGLKPLEMLDCMRKNGFLSEVQLYTAIALLDNIFKKEYSTIAEYLSNPCVVFYLGTTSERNPLKIQEMLNLLKKSRLLLKSGTPLHYCVEIKRVINDIYKTRDREEQDLKEKYKSLQEQLRLMEIQLNEKSQSQPDPPPTTPLVPTEIKPKPETKSKPEPKLEVVAPKPILAETEPNIPKPIDLETFIQNQKRMHQLFTQLSNIHKPKPEPETVSDNLPQQQKPPEFIQSQTTNQNEYWLYKNANRLAEKGLKIALDLFYSQKQSTLGPKTAALKTELKKFIDLNIYGELQPEDEKPEKLLNLIDEKAQEIIINLNQLNLSNTDGLNLKLVDVITSQHEKHLAISFIKKPIQQILEIENKKIRKQKIDTLFSPDYRMEDLIEEFNLRAELFPYFDFSTKTVQPQNTGVTSTSEVVTPWNNSLKSETIKNKDGSIISILADGINEAGGQEASSRAVRMIEDLNREIGPNSTTPEIIKIMKNTVYDVSNELVEEFESRGKTPPRCKIVIVHVSAGADLVCLSLGESLFEIYKPNGEIIFKSFKNPDRFGKLNHDYSPYTDFESLIYQTKLSPGQKVVLKSSTLEQVNIAKLIQTSPPSVSAGDLAQKIIQENSDSNSKSLTIINFLNMDNSS